MNRRSFFSVALAGFAAALTGKARNYCYGVDLARQRDVTGVVIFDEIYCHQDGALVDALRGQLARGRTRSLPLVYRIP